MENISIPYSALRFFTQITKERRNDFIGNKTQTEILRHYYDMIYPQTLRENEYIRLLALRRDTDGKIVNKIVKFVQSFDAYKNFVQKYRYTHDVYNQLATNRGNENGTASSQRLRRVLFLDFDFKDYPNYHDAHEFTDMIKQKIPKIYLHACNNSGHGFHFYISVKANVGDFQEVIELNKELVSFLGADTDAAKTTQIDRPPCTYNHKLNDGTYDYDDISKWSYVKEINNAYMVGNQFREYDLSYIRKRLNYCIEDQNTQQVLDKIDWHYEDLNEYPCYLCVRKMLNEGADKGQRNFWHGRIVKLLQMEGYTESKIYSMCQEYNSKCRPPKSKEEIESDTKRYLSQNYSLLGCYESISDPVKSKWVEEQCDKVYCGTYHNGAKISIDENNSAKINKKILLNKDLRTMTGNEYLIITILDVYKNSFGRRGFRVKNLKELLYSSIRDKPCIADRLLRTLLLDLEEKKWIEIIPDSKKPKKFVESRLKLTRRLKEFQQGYIEFYFSIARSLIDGCITQKEYIVFITLVRNLSDGKKVTYDQLAEDLEMDKNNIAKCIKKLQKERCLIIEKEYTDKGYECNKYHMINPEYLREQIADNDIPVCSERTLLREEDADCKKEEEIRIKLLA